MVDCGGPWEAGGERSPGLVGKFGRGVGRAPGWAGLTLTATVPAGAERRCLACYLAFLRAAGSSLHRGGIFRSFSLALFFF